MEVIGNSLKPEGIGQTIFSGTILVTQFVLTGFVLFQECGPIASMFLWGSTAGVAIWAILHFGKGEAISSEEVSVLAASRMRAIEETLNRDCLTGVLNRRALEHRALSSLRIGRTLGTQYFVAIADIDHFKQINDRHGHQSGDIVLQCVATILRSGLRSGECIARYGGEEFCLLVESDSLVSVLRRMDEMRRKVEVHAPGIMGDVVSAVTVSIGIAEWRFDLREFEQVVEQADAALYEAKSKGRNCVRWSSSEDGESMR